MTCAIKNTTGKDMSTVGNMITDYFPYAKKEMGFDQPVTVLFKSDSENAKNPLGKTAYYDPANFKIVLYVDGRHPKDLMRSFSHELVHHKQNCNGELEGIAGEQGYAQTESGARIEEEAYSLGNTIFRNWEDSMKKRVNETTYLKRGKTTMDEKILKQAIKKVLLKNRKIAEALRESIKRSSEEEGTSAQAPSENEAKESKLKETIRKAIKNVLEGKGKKPDFLDLDKDGDEDEPMKKAAKEKKKEEVQEEGVVEEAVDCGEVKNQVASAQATIEQYPDKASQVWAHIRDIKANNPECFKAAGGPPALEEKKEVLEEEVSCQDKCREKYSEHTYDYNDCVKGCYKERAPKKSSWYDDRAHLLSAHEGQEPEKGKEELEEAHDDDWYTSTKKPDWEKPESEEEEEKEDDDKKKKKPVKEWYDTSLHERLVQKYTRRKK